MPVIRKFKVKRRKGAVARPACKKRLNCRTVRLPGQKSDQVVVACRTAGELKEYGERLRRRARCAAKKEAAARREAAAKKRKGRKSPSTASTARATTSAPKSAPREEAAPKKRKSSKGRKSPSTASTARAARTSEARPSASESSPRATARAAAPRKSRAASSKRGAKSRASKSEPRRLEASRTSSAHGLEAGDSRSPFLLGAGQERKLPSNLRAALERMGLEWPTTQKKVSARFGALAMRMHPDRGGSNQQMRVLMQDRKTILSAIAVNSDD